MPSAIAMVLRFNVCGLTRYLSHVELMRVFQRAALRAEWPLAFSSGFNPRPRISLPLPKPVGVESEGDLAQFRIAIDQIQPQVCRDLADGLQRQLPEGIFIKGAWTIPATSNYHAVSAVYHLHLDNKLDIAAIKARCETFLASNTHRIDRSDRPGRSGVDIRPFIEQIIFGNGVSIHYKIINGKTIRVKEMLDLIGISAVDLNAPIHRRSIQWQISSKDHKTILDTTDA